MRMLIISVNNDIWNPSWIKRKEWTNTYLKKEKSVVIFMSEIPPPTTRYFLPSSHLNKKYHFDYCPWLIHWHPNWNLFAEFWFHEGKTFFSLKEITFSKLTLAHLDIISRDRTDALPGFLFSLPHVFSPQRFCATFQWLAFLVFIHIPNKDLRMFSRKLVKRE